MELALALALRAERMRAVWRKAFAPQKVQARRVIGVGTHELHDGVLRPRGRAALGVVSIDRRHLMDLRNVGVKQPDVPAVGAGGSVDGQSGVGPDGIPVARDV